MERHKIWSQGPIPYLSWFFTVQLPAWLTSLITSSRTEPLTQLRCVFMSHHFPEYPRDWGWSRSNTWGPRASHGHLTTQVPGPRGGSVLSRCMWLTWTTDPINDRAESKKLSRIEWDGRGAGRSWLWQLTWLAACSCSLKSFLLWWGQVTTCANVDGVMTWKREAKTCWNSNLMGHLC